MTCVVDMVSHQARRGRTAIISTSHVSVARIADVIAVLHNGEVIEQGTPSELLESRGAYAYLCTIQVGFYNARIFFLECVLCSSPSPSPSPSLTKSFIIHMYPNWDIRLFSSTLKRKQSNYKSV